MNKSEIKLDIKGSDKLGYTYKNGADKKITGKKVRFASEDQKTAKVSSKG